MSFPIPVTLSTRVEIVSPGISGLLIPPISRLYYPMVIFCTSFLHRLQYSVRFLTTVSFDTLASFFLHSGQHNHSSVCFPDFSFLMFTNPNYCLYSKMLGFIKSYLFKIRGFLRLFLYIPLNTNISLYSQILSLSKLSMTAAMCDFEPPTLYLYIYSLYSL